MQNLWPLLLLCCLSGNWNNNCSLPCGDGCGCNTGCGVGDNCGCGLGGNYGCGDGCGGGCNDCACCGFFYSRGCDGRMRRICSRCYRPIPDNCGVCGFCNPGGCFNNGCCNNGCGSWGGGCNGLFDLLRCFW